MYGNLPIPLLLLLPLPYLLPSLLSQDHYRHPTLSLAALIRSHVILHCLCGSKGVWLGLLSTWVIGYPPSLFPLSNPLVILGLTLQTWGSLRPTLLLAMIVWQGVLHFNICSFRCLCFIFLTCTLFLFMITRLVFNSVSMGNPLLN